MTPSPQAERAAVVAAVWRCAIGDAVCAAVMLKDQWLRSRRKADRAAGEQLGRVLDLIFTARDPAPSNYRDANALGEAMKRRVLDHLKEQPE